MKMPQRRKRFFATLHSDGTMQTAPNIQFAINKFQVFKDKASKYRVDAVVELDEKNNIMRWILSNIEYGFEMCPHCEGESIMKAEFRSQHCTECGKLILPCHLCDCDYCNCGECPLKGKYHKYIGGVKPTGNNEFK